ncbi:IS3 family transposase [Acinetobacter baumannii]|uniref:IS3 family transposase n=1 Tax=Acinetobacter baumannii TaxID=470 RepID=UPI00396B11F8
MAKYSQEFKLEVVQYYLSGFGRHQVSHKFGIHHSDVAKWVANYNNHGAEGLSRKNTNTVYTPEFKFKVIQSVLEQGLSVREATNQFNLKNALNDRDKTQEQLLEELAYLRAENAYLKKRRALSEAERTGTSRTATVTRFISELRQNYKLKYLLRASQMARSTYFYHEQRSKLNDKYSDLKQQIKMIYHKHKGRYGYRRITLALKNMGLTINHKCVQRLMQSMKLKSRIRIAKYRSYKGDIGQVADNVLQRQFKADKPNQKWVTDVTEFNIRGDRLYLSPIMDLFNGEIIAFQTHRRPMYELVKNMLKDALTKLADHEKPIIHSDQGWQYQMRHYQRELAENGLTQSMSRKGNCLDNASMESFFGILKSECFYGEKFNSVEELEKTVKEYIHYYNHERIKVKLKGLSPVQYRTQSLEAA